MIETAQRVPRYPLWRYFQLNTTPMDIFFQLAEFGDMVRYSLGRSFYFVNDPAVIHDILISHADNYTKVKSGYERVAMAAGEGLITESGEAWKMMRDWAGPLMHTKFLDQLIETVMMHNDYLVERLHRVAKKDDVIDISDEIVMHVLELSSLMLFGVDIRDQSRHVLKQMIISSRYASRHMIPGKFAPTIINARFRRAQKILDQFIYDVSIKSLKKPDTPEAMFRPIIQAGFDDNDTRIDKDKLLQQVKSFLLPGHETTGTALTWSCYNLMRHRDALKLLRKEVAEAFNPKNMPYTDAVIYESMRLYPPAWVFDRVSVHEDVAGGYMIPANSSIMFAPYVLHRDPRYWEHPNMFWPHRFLMPDPNRPKCAYLAFGVGPRICIGKQMAMLIGRLTLASLFEKFDLVPAYKQPIELDALITLKPKGGIPVRLKCIK